MKGGSFRHDNTAPPVTQGALSRFSNRGKTAIVSGSGAGIGLSVARALAESGANVAIWYNSNKSALDRAAEIEKEFNVHCESKVVHGVAISFDGLRGPSRDDKLMRLTT